MSSLYVVKLDGREVLGPVPRSVADSYVNARTAKRAAAVPRAVREARYVIEPTEKTS